MFFPALVICLVFWETTLESTGAVQLHADIETEVHSEVFDKLISPEKDKLLQLFTYIDQNEGKFRNRLREAITIPSMSCVTDTKACFQMINWTEATLTSLGFQTEELEIGIQAFDRENVQLPPVFIGSLGNDPNKNTLLLYGHLDVSPAKISDGWYTNPFNLTEVRGNLYGRGASDDKGPSLSWINAIEAFVSTGIEIPINIKVILECMEECGSMGLADALHLVQGGFLSDISAVTLSDSTWLTSANPGLSYGTRGLVYFYVEVVGGTKDLHSGIFGGAVQEALPDLIWLLNQLTDAKGNILIKKVLTNVRELTAEEEEQYDSLEFDMKEFKELTGARGLRYPNSKKDTIMRLWRYPSLSIHGIEGAFAEPGAKTVIPSRLVGKFSIRLVPDQNPERIVKVVKEYLEDKWIERGSANKLKVTTGHKAKPWIGNFTNSNYEAAARATEIVHGMKPQYIKDGGTIPITTVLEQLTGKNVLHLPIGKPGDGAHSQNEKISHRNYILGSKMYSAYFLELGKALGKVVSAPTI